MRLRLRSNFGFDGPREVDFDAADTATLGDLLGEIAERYGCRLLVVDGTAVVDDVHVTVNERDHLFIPERLGAPLAEGDEIRISFLPLGGG